MLADKLKCPLCTFLMLSRIKRLIAIDHIYELPKVLLLLQFKIQMADADVCC
uniref:Uncharacterized protein n=1 Tax=Arundo donax TaxID=35708 RepID=A0A0A9C0V2_ARUDO